MACRMWGTGVPGRVVLACQMMARDAYGASDMGLGVWEQKRKSDGLVRVRADSARQVGPVNRTWAGEGGRMRDEQARGHWLVGFGL